MIDLNANKIMELENTTPEPAETIGGKDWQPTTDLGQQIDNYINDFILLECGAESLKDLGALQWSSCCFYVGSHIRPLSPLPKPKKDYSINWMESQGAKDYFLFMLNQFLYFCGVGGKVPFVMDFWKFSGLALLEIPLGFALDSGACGITPDWVESIVNIIKTTEKQGLESILTDRKTNTQGTLALLQNRHGYNSTGSQEQLHISVIKADSLPFFGNIAQCQNENENE